MNMELKFVLESLLFSSQKPLTPKELRELLSATAASEDADETSRAFKKTKEPEVLAALEQLAAEHQQAARSYRLVCVAGAWQFACEPGYAPWLRAMFGIKARPPRLSQSALETLAIIAYRQPVTRSEIEQIRGVSVDGVMQTILERHLIESVGRAEVVGRPVLYGTTSNFLEYFGLGTLADLPDAEELRRIPVQKPETLATVDGLATLPPEQLTLAGDPKTTSESPVPSAENPKPEEPGETPSADGGTPQVEIQPPTGSLLAADGAVPVEGTQTDAPSPRPKGRRKRKTDVVETTPAVENQQTDSGNPVPETIVEAQPPAEVPQENEPLSGQ